MSHFPPNERLFTTFEILDERPSRYSRAHHCIELLIGLCLLQWHALPQPCVQWKYNRKSHFFCPYRLSQHAPSRPHAKLPPRRKTKRRTDMWTFCPVCICSQCSFIEACVGGVAKCAWHCCCWPFSPFCMAVVDGSGACNRPAEQRLLTNRKPHTRGWVKATGEVRLVPTTVQAASSDLGPVNT